MLNAWTAEKMLFVKYQNFYCKSRLHFRGGTLRSVPPGAKFRGGTCLRASIMVPRRMSA